MFLISFGTRAEWLKVKSLVDELKKKGIEFKTLFTGQHVDLLNEIKTDYKIGVTECLDVDRLSNLFGSIIQLSSQIFTKGNIKYVMVQGDTTSAIAVAMAAYHNQIPIIHLEAGLRTYDLNNPYPEEANRQLISRIASIHLCPTYNNFLNLEHENVGGKKYIVGNTALDNLHDFIQKCEFENKILVTLHRRENHEIIVDWFTAINKIAIKYPNHEFVLPIHPNPNVKKHVDILTNVKVLEPLSHEDLLNILVKCKFVITDSGGIQEECSFLNKKVIVCRKETERPEAIGYTTQLCESPIELKSMVSELMENYEIQHEHECPFGDGHSAKKILKILKYIL